MAISDYNSTPVSNSDISGINIAEGCSPAGINNAIRQMMADIKDYYDLTNPASAITVSGAWTVSGEWTYTENQKHNDTVRALFGTGSDMQIYHDGLNSRINDTSVGFIMRCNSFLVRNAAGSEDMIEAVADGFVKLRYNNTARLTTTSTGVTITGDLAADTFSGAAISTNIATDTGLTTKVPHVAAVEAFVATLPFSGEYVSAEQTITSAGQLVLAHGLGARPKIVTYSLVCQTDNVGYTAGDEIDIGAGEGSNPTATTVYSGGMSVILDATNITLRYGSATSVFSAIRPDTGAVATLTNASWKLVVRAWA